MNTRRLISAILAISLSSSGLAFAQRSGDRHDRPGDRNDQTQRDGQYDRRDNDYRRDYREGDRRGYRAGDRQDYRQRGQQDYRQGHLQEYRQGARWDDYRGDYRGAGPNHSFYRGQRLPPAYNNRYYVVDDWRGHRLSAPPYGYRWVQTGGDYVLVAIATGIIAQLLLGN